MSKQLGGKNIFYLIFEHIKLLLSSLQLTFDFSLYYSRHLTITIVT